LILTGEDFFLFCDPYATPVLAFLFPCAATAGTASLGVFISAAARPAAGMGPSPGKGSPASSSYDVAALAAADPSRILLTITWGEIPGFITKHSFVAATGPFASTGRPFPAAVGSTADIVTISAVGSTADATAGSIADSPAADFSTGSKANTGNVSLTGPTAAAGSAAGATAADSAANTDSSILAGSAATTCSIAGEGDSSPAGPAAGSTAPEFCDIYITKQCLKTVHYSTFRS
jgi:hypothetical protein